MSEDSHLTAYQQALSQQATYTVRVVHSFLPLQREAAYEQQSFFSATNSTSNFATIIAICESVGIKYPALPPATQTSLSDSNSGIVSGADVNASPSVVALIVSVGTSSTQTFTAQGVVAAQYIGALAFEADPCNASAAFSLLLAEASTLHTGCGSDRRNFFPVILTNSISFWVQSTVLLNGFSGDVYSLLDQSALIKAKEAGGDEGKVLKLEQELLRRRNALAALISVASSEQTNPLHIPCILRAKASGDNFKYGWGEVMAELEVSSPSSVYIVDFGGGGPDIRFYPGDGTSVAVASDRSLRTGQEAFVDEMKRGGDVRHSKVFRGIESFIKRRVLSHYLSLDLTEEGGGSLDGDREVNIFCKVIQTGKARQQHFLGHYDPDFNVHKF